jgi:hypothetical protein
MLAGLTGGRIRLPDSVINYGNSPLPQIPPGATQMYTADGLYNHVANLLPIMGQPYAYGNSARISTQTQMAHPNRVALIIPKLYIPAPESDGHDSSGDPVLEHAISDGDLVFTFRMGGDMAGYGSSYCEAPYGHAAKAVPLLNLATVNYILWGLQVGLRRPKNRRWSDFFNKLTQGALEKHLRTNGGKALDEATVWSFIRTYLRPFGIQHGGDQQGGMHEGDGNRIVTHGAVDYVSSFAIEGRLQHVNNLWRDSDVHENDDLILALRHKTQSGDLFFNLSSSVRSSRTERVPVPSGYFYLRPETLQYRSFADMCYVYVGRSFKYCSMYMRVPEAACWDARVAVVPGAPIMLTFEPDLVDSEDIFYASLMFDNGCDLGDSESSKNKRQDIKTIEAAELKAKNRLENKRKNRTKSVRTAGDMMADVLYDDDEEEEEEEDPNIKSDHPSHSINLQPKKIKITTVEPKPNIIENGILPTNTKKLSAILDTQVATQPSPKPTAAPKVPKPSAVEK